MNGHALPLPVPDGSITIDQSTPDEFLDCVRSGFPQANAHGSTAEAVERLLSFSSSPFEANIIGHGMEGGIITGTGEPPCTPDLQRCMTLLNRDLWSPLLQQLQGRAVNLTLWSCDTGAGTDGAELLSLMADLIQAPVAASTGIIQCLNGNLSLLPPATWQIARPGQKPFSIPVLAQPIQAIRSLSLLEDGGTMETPLNDLQGAKYQLRTSTGDGPVWTLPTGQARGLAQLIDFSHLAILKGVLGTVTTGRLTFFFANRPEPLRLLVLNDRILRDEDNRTAYYYTFAGFSGALHQIFRLGPQ